MKIKTCPECGKNAVVIIEHNCYGEMEGSKWFCKCGFREFIPESISIDEYENLMWRMANPKESWIDAGTMTSDKPKYMGKKNDDN